MTGWGEYLFNAIGKSDVTAVSKLRQEGPRGEDAWNAHLTLFPAVQRVLNPPFINPHLPKMYAICRELRPYMELEDIPGLLYMESIEYARRQKLELHLRPVPETEGDGASMPFSKIEEAIRSRDAQIAASYFAAYVRQHGARELARRLLLIGSGYLVESLGHSLSCTVFILQEMLARQDQDPWPALVVLADYFIKGRFDTTPSFRKPPQPIEQSLPDLMLRSTAGSSFIDIHHTITLYAIERARELVSREEHEHLVASWLDWMGKKEPRATLVEAPEQGYVLDYAMFYRAFSALDTEAVTRIAVPLTASAEGRKLAGRFLIKGLCDLYQGDYNPHYVTGLGAMLWVVGQHADQPSLVSNALHQYVGFLFRALGGN